MCSWSPITQCNQKEPTSHQLVIIYAGIFFVGFYSLPMYWFLVIRMASCLANAFRITGPLWWNSPHKGPVPRSSVVCFVTNLKKKNMLNKQPNCLWFHTSWNLHLPEITCMVYTAYCQICLCPWQMLNVRVSLFWWRHNDHDSVLNHQPQDCLLNRLFRRRSKKTSKLRVTGLCVGNSPLPVNSPRKGPVTRKLCPFDDYIMSIRCSVSKNVYYTARIWLSAAIVKYIPWNISTVL